MGRCGGSRVKRGPPIGAWSGQRWAWRGDLAPRSQLQASNPTAAKRVRAAHDAAGTQVADQRAGIEVRDYRDAGLAEKGVGLHVGAPVADDGRELADHHAFDVGAGGFAILDVGAQLPICGFDDLAGVGGSVKTSWYPVRAVLKTTSPERSAGAPKRLPSNTRAVFQGEDCRVQVRLFLQGCGSVERSGLIPILV